MYSFCCVLNTRKLCFSYNRLPVTLLNGAFSRCYWVTFRVKSLWLKFIGSSAAAEHTSQAFLDVTFKQRVRYWIDSRVYYIQQVRYAQKDFVLLRLLVAQLIKYSVTQFVYVADDKHNDSNTDQLCRRSFLALCRRFVAAFDSLIKTKLWHERSILTRMSSNDEENVAGSERQNNKWDSFIEDEIKNPKCLSVYVVW